MNSCDCLNAQDTFTDMLLVEKTIVKQYATALTEMNDESLRELIKENLNYAADDQNKIYCKMQELGWYKTCPAEQEKIDQALQKFCCCK